MLLPHRARDPVAGVQPRRFTARRPLIEIDKDWQIGIRRRLDDPTLSIRVEDGTGDRTVDRLPDGPRAQSPAQAIERDPRRQLQRGTVVNADFACGVGWMIHNAPLAPAVIRLYPTGDLETLFAIVDALQLSRTVEGTIGRTSIDRQGGRVRAGLPGDVWPNDEARS